MAVSELNGLSGLSDKEAEAAERKYGANAVAFKGSLRSSFAESFSSLSVRLLIISVLSDVVLLLLGMLGFAPAFGAYERTVTVFAAMLIIGIIGGVMRENSRKILWESFSVLPKGECNVIRNRKAVIIPASEVCTGDVVIVFDGDVIPADGVVIDGFITVEQSALGSSVPVEKTAAPDGYRHGGMNIKDPYSVYCGSSVVKGFAAVKITAVGENTRLAKKSEDAVHEIPETAFSGIKKLDAVTGIILAAIVITVLTVNGAAAGNFPGGLFQGISCGALILSAVTVGGKAIVLNAFGADSVKRLKDGGTFLQSGECLAEACGTDIIMTEREGMITAGKYVVSGFIDGSGKEYGKFSEISKGLAKFLKTAVLAAVNVGIYGGEAVGGNSADRAIFGFIGGGSENMKLQTEAEGNGIYGVTVTLGNGLATVIRGSSDAVLERCGEYFGADGKKHRITNKDALRKLAETLRLNGKDIAAFGFSDKGIKGGNVPESGCVFVGFIALQDGYPEETADSVKCLKSRGIKTMIVTSGSRENILFTVKYAGIKKSGGVVVDAEQLGKMNAAQLSEQIEKINAVVGVSAREKLRLANTARRKGKNLLFAGNFAEDAAVLRESAVSMASASAPACVKQVSGAFAENDKLGIVCAEKLISESVRFNRSYKIFLILRAVLALMLSAAVMFFGW